MTRKVIRLKKSQTYVPQSLSQANILLGELGNTQDNINAIEKELKDKIEKLKARAEKKLQPLAIKRENQVNALFTFADPRKKELTKELRTVNLTLGVFGWRLTPPRVETDGKSEGELIAFLKSTGYKNFVRIIEEIDRKALLAERPVICGISYVQTDEFFVVPNQACEKKKTLTHTIDR